MPIRQFAFHERVPTTAPECLIKELHDKCEKGEKLSAYDKERIFESIRSYNGIYRLSGWEFDFRPFMKRFIVNTYDNWSPIFAFSKGNIRKNVYTRNGVKEIHEIPNNY